MESFPGKRSRAAGRLLINEHTVKYRWDEFVLDTDAYRLHKAGVAVPLEPKAFNLLVWMVQRPAQLLTKQEIFEAIWPRTAVTDHALTRVIALLRRALGDEAREARYIETVPTRGYRWVCPVEVVFHRSASPSIVAESPLQSRRAGVAAALTLGAAALALSVWAPWRDASGAPSIAVAQGIRAVWPRQQTTHPGLDLQPAYSPQGDALAFVSDFSGAQEIYVRDLGAAGIETAVTNDGAQNVQPAWSPDGRLLAYHSNRQGGIWIVPARGGIPRQVAATGSRPAWSPDGRRLAFQSDEQIDVTPMAFAVQSGSTLWIVNADGTDLHELTSASHPVGGHAAPAWSRDGRLIAFSNSDAGAGGGLWLLDLATREPRVLYRGQGLFEFVFAPDDSAIYAAGGEAMIVRLPLDPKTHAMNGPRTVVPVPGVPGVRGLTMSANGDRLAFAGVSLSSHIWAQPIDSDGSASAPPQQLTNDTSRRNSMAAVSPDGSQVAYMSSRGGEPPNLWVMNRRGGGRVQLTTDDAAEDQPLWSADGRRIAFNSERRGTNGVWTADLRTRREELLFDLTSMRTHADAPKPAGRIAEVRLAPSMRRAAFSVVSPATGRRVMHVTGMGTFAPRALTDGALSVGYPAWSPDERSLAVEVKEGSSTNAGVIDLRSGRLRLVTHERGQTWVRSWSPDGRKIAVAALRNGSWSLQWVEVEGGRQGTITPPARSNIYMRYPDWSPRGDVVVFERGELRGNIWTVALK